MMQKALRLSPTHDPLVVQGLASLQTHVSTRLLGSLTALDFEANYQKSVGVFRFSTFSGITK